MLHIVQVVFVGMAERPQVFFDQSGAESAFVEQVKKCWKQSYSDYCERNGVGMDSFASARDFLETLDLSEKSRINYWVVNPEDAGPGMMENPEEIRHRREKIGNLVRQVEQRSDALRAELAGLLDDLRQLTDDFGEINAPSSEVQAVEPEGDTGLSPKSAEQDVPEESAEKYTTREWKAFVGSIMNMSGGSRSEFPLLPRSDWRQDVYSNSTSLEYWDWVAARIGMYREKAEKADCTVIEDPASPGHYTYRTSEGSVGETSFYSEWEAWCAAGMHLTKEPPAAAG